MKGMCNYSTLVNFTGYYFDSCGDNASNNDLNQVYYALYGVIMNAMLIFGVVGNILSILVFLSPRIWACLNFYLIALALWDVALLISSFAQWGIWSLVFNGAPILRGPHSIVLWYAYIAGNITLTGCVWVIVTLTIERYLAIMKPLQHRAMDNAGRAKVILFCVSLAAILYNIGRPFEIEVITDNAVCCEPNTQDLTMVPYIQPTSLRGNKLYFLLYRVVGSMLFVYLVPCVILAVLTVQMCLAIRSANAFNQQFSSSRSADSNLEMRSRCSSNTVEHPHKHSQRVVRNPPNSSTNKMLSAVLIKFLLCYTLPVVTDLLEIFLTDEQFNDKNIECLIIVTNCLVVLNSCLNIVIYLTIGRRFRHEFCRLTLMCFYFARGKELPKSHDFFPTHNSSMTTSNSRNHFETSSGDRTPMIRKKETFLTSQDSSDSTTRKNGCSKGSSNYLSVPTFDDSMC